MKKTLVFVLNYLVSYFFIIKWTRYMYHDIVVGYPEHDKTRFDLRALIANSTSEEINKGKLCVVTHAFSEYIAV